MSLTAICGAVGVVISGVDVIELVFRWAVVRLARLPAPSPPYTRMNLFGTGRLTRYEGARRTDAGIRIRTSRRFGQTAQSDSGEEEPWDRDVGVFSWLEGTADGPKSSAGGGVYTSSGSGSIGGS